MEKVPLSLKDILTAEEYTFLCEGAKRELSYDSSQIFLHIYGKYRKKCLSRTDFGHSMDYNIRKKSIEVEKQKQEEKKETSCKYCTFLPKRKTRSVVTIKGQDFYLIKKNVENKATKTVQAYRMTDGRYIAFHWTKDELIDFIRERI